MVLVVSDNWQIISNDEIIWYVHFILSTNISGHRDEIQKDFLKEIFISN
jgi:hypothetical protein